MGKIIKYILSGILIVILLGLLALLIWGGDTAPVEDSELLPSKVRIAEEDNLVYEFKPWMNKIERKLVFLNQKEASGEFREVYWPEGIYNSISSLIENKDWDEQLVSEVLRKNSESLSEFNSIMEKSNLSFQIPKLKTSQNFKPLSAQPTFRNLRRLMKINILNSYSLLREGEHEQALDRAIKTVEAAYAMQNAENQTLLQSLIGIKPERQALRAFKRITSEATLSSQEAKRYILRLNKINNHQENFRRALKFKYLLCKKRKDYFDKYISGEELDSSTEIYKELDQFFGGPTGSIIKFLAKFGYFYKPNKTDQIIADNFRPHITDTDRFYKDIEKWELPYNYIDTSSSKFGELMTKNFVGKVYLRFFLVNTQGALVDEYKLNYEAESSQLLLALKAHKQQHGALPSKLEKLIPTYLKEVPLDPFDGEDLRYSKENKILYSVGKDLKDNRGDNEKDLVTEIKF